MVPEIRVIIQYKNESLNVPEGRKLWDYAALAARLPDEELQRFGSVFEQFFKAIKMVEEERGREWKYSSQSLGCSCSSLSWSPQSQTSDDKNWPGQK